MKVFCLDSSVGYECGFPKSKAAGSIPARGTIFNSLKGFHETDRN
jgi:hypothetical protein